MAAASSNGLMGAPARVHSARRARVRSRAGRSTLTVRVLIPFLEGGARYPQGRRRRSLRHGRVGGGKTQLSRRRSPPMASGMIFAPPPPVKRLQSLGAAASVWDAQIPRRCAATAEVEQGEEVIGGGGGVLLRRSAAPPSGVIRPQRHPPPVKTGKTVGCGPVRLPMAADRRRHSNAWRFANWWYVTPWGLKFKTKEAAVVDYEERGGADAPIVSTVVGVRSRRRRRWRCKNFRRQGPRRSHRGGGRRGGRTCTTWQPWALCAAAKAQRRRRRRWRRGRGRTTRQVGDEAVRRVPRSRAVTASERRRRARLWTMSFARRCGGRSQGGTPLMQKKKAEDEGAEDEGRAQRRRRRNAETSPPRRRAKRRRAKEKKKSKK